MPNAPAPDPAPILDPAYTAQFMENVVVKPSPIDGVVRAVLKKPAP